VSRTAGASYSQQSVSSLDPNKRSRLKKKASVNGIPLAFLTTRGPNTEEEQERLSKSINSLDIELEQLVLDKLQGVAEEHSVLPSALDRKNQSMPSDPSHTKESIIEESKSILDEKASLLSSTAREKMTHLGSSPLPSK
jgi:hypothetical protein